MLSSSRSNSSLPHKLKRNNTFTTNPTLIANSFNDYFSGVGKTLADQLKPSSESEHTKYLTKRLRQSLFLTPTTSFEVFNLISGLKNTKSNGKDNISAYFLKVAAKVIAALLAQLFNYSFLLRIFPASLKIAKIVPIYKSGDKSNISNYRAISILSPISKILQKLIHIRSINFFNKHSVLLPTQCGFRVNHSTTHALTDVLTSLQRWSRGHKARGQGQGQGHKKNPRPRPRTAFPRTDALEAKDRNARGQGQGPRTQSASALQKKKKKKVFTKIFQAISKIKKKKKVFTKIFQAISTKKRFPDNFSSPPQNFNIPKNSAVLEPRTGQFSRT